MKENERHRSAETLAPTKNGAPAQTADISRQAVATLQRARLQYAAEWGNSNARQFAMDGHYRWMASFLDDYPKILEIGTGNGSGTSALLSSGHVVVSLDENPECLKIAGQNLKRAGFDVAYERREIIQPDQTGYTITYAVPKSSKPEKGALLLEGDILNDPTLIEWIDKNGPFDAIVCWLIGTYYERTHNIAIADLAIANPGQYRLKIHSDVCKFADQMLASSGALHYVDRGEPPESPAVLAQHRDYYRSLASGTSLQIVSIDYARYQEPLPDANIAIKLTPTAPGKDPDLAAKAFVSAVFRKP